MKPLWIINKLIFPINKALLAASVNAGKDKKLNDLDWRPRIRIKIWLWSEWFHWWRWKGIYIRLNHLFIMWQHKHHFLCRCVTHFQKTGSHASDCPKSKEWRKAL